MAGGGYFSVRFFSLRTAAAAEDLFARTARSSGVMDAAVFFHQRPKGKDGGALVTTRPVNTNNALQCFHRRYPA